MEFPLFVSYSDNPFRCTDERATAATSVSTSEMTWYTAFVAGLVTL
jgi:hypothetical protein